MTLFSLVALLLPSLALAGPATAAPAAVPHAAAAHAVSAPSAASPRDEQTADVVLGTFNLAANDTGGSGGLFGELMHNRFTFNIAPPCHDCQITALKPDLTDTNGNSVDMNTTGAMLHHFVLFKAGGTDVSCPGLGVDTWMGERLFASGEEKTQIPDMSQYGYGLYIGPSDSWSMVSDLMNYASTPQTVQVRLHVTYVPGHTLKDVTPVWLDETGPCLWSYYDIPAGQSDTSTTWTSTISGKILGLGGHLHENGTHITATDVTTNQQLCDSKESQMTVPNGPAAGQVMVMNMSTCMGSPPDFIGELHQGDQIKMDAYYDAPQAQQGVMGIMIMYVAQD